MTKLQVLNRLMKNLELDGIIGEEEYATYKQLLEAARLLNDFHDRATQAGWHPDNSPMRDYVSLLEKLK